MVTVSGCARPRAQQAPRVPTRPISLELRRFQHCCARGRCSFHASGGREQRARGSPSPPLEEGVGERRPITLLDAAVCGEIPAGRHTHRSGVLADKDDLLSLSLSSKGGEGTGAPPREQCGRAPKPSLAGRSPLPPQHQRPTVRQPKIVGDGGAHRPPGPAFGGHQRGMRRADPTTFGVEDHCTRLPRVGPPPLYPGPTVGRITQSLGIGCHLLFRSALFSAILHAMFTGRRKVLVLLAAALVVGAVVAVNQSSDEPSYGGRPLSAWLLQCQMFSLTGTEQRMQADQAIRHIGTNAIPYLLQYIQYETPVWKTKTQVDINELLRRLGRDWRWRDRRVARAQGAAVAFQVLGTDAEGAIGELTRLMNQTNSRATRFRAAYTLPCLGAKSIPPLLAVLTNQQAEVRAVVTSSLQPLGTNARPLVPTLIQCLQDKDTVVSMGAPQALGGFKIERSTAVPALIDSLQNPRTGVRGMAARSLPEFGVEALPALPALSNLLNDPSPPVRREATNAIARLNAATKNAAARQVLKQTPSSRCVISAHTCLPPIAWQPLRRRSGDDRHN